MIVDVKTSQPYQVHIRAGARTELAELGQNSHRIAIIHPPTCSTRARELAAVTGSGCLLIETPDAEAAKTSEVLTMCWNKLAEAGFTRDDLIAGLGGGATTDLAGFVAASWLRGVRYISIPTSVLGMVDAAVGGKTGINLDSGKNLVGAFWEPQAVLCDLELLDSLPAEEVSSGLAEVIKCGFIADPVILDLVSGSAVEATDVTSTRFAELVYRAIQVKAAVVAADLRERTSRPGQVGREALNYGHTLGHAIEACEHYSWRHGPAIAVGMMWMSEVSHRLLGLDGDAVTLHRDLLASVALPTSYLGEWRILRSLMNLDKKVRGSSLRLIGLPEIGQVELIVEPDEGVLHHCFYLLSR